MTLDGPVTISQTSAGIVEPCAGDAHGDTGGPKIDRSSPVPTQADTTARLVALGLSGDDAAAYSSAVFTFAGTGGGEGSLVAILFHQRRLRAQGINPTVLAEILAFILQILPIILPLFGL